MARAPLATRRGRPSGRALAAASPPPRGPAATSSPAGTPRPRELTGGGVGAEVIRSLGISPPGWGPPRNREGVSGASLLTLS